MWRTSSPGKYGRIICNSVPWPVCGVRCSPGTSESIFFITARSRDRRTAGGTGPGPGLAGERSGGSTNLTESPPTGRNALWAIAPSDASAQRESSPVSRQPPHACEPEARARQQQHQRATRERRRDLLLDLGLGQPRADVRVDGLEAAGVRGGEELPAGVARDVLQRQQVRRDLLA